MKRITVLILGLFAIFLIVVLLLMLTSNRPALAQDICRDDPIVYDCWPDFGCAVDPIFYRTVSEMAAHLNLPDDNYRPCRLIIDTDAGRFEVSHPLLTICWAWRDVCGTTGRDFVSAIRGEGVILEHTQVWLERHIPNHLPIIVEKSGWRDEDWKRGDIILPVAPGYPLPPSNVLPPYP